MNDEGAPPCAACGSPMTPWLSARDRDGGPPRPLRRCTRPGCGVARTAHPAADPTDVAGASSSGDATRRPAAAPSLAPGRGPASRLGAAIVARQVAPLLRRVPRGAHVLDIGAGSGLRASVLAAAGCRVTAIEPDRDEFAVLQPGATAHPGVTAVHGGIDDLAVHVPAGSGGDADPLPGGGPADGAVMWHVLEHLEDPAAGLRHVRAALRPGAPLLVAVPNAASWEAAAFRGRWHSWDPARHVWHLTPPALALLLARAGLVGIRAGARGGWGYPAGLAYSLAPTWDPQASGAAGRSAARGMALAAALIPVAAATVAAGRGPQIVALACAPPEDRAP